MKPLFKAFVLFLFSLMLGLTDASARVAPGFMLMSNNDYMVSKSHLQGNLIVSFFASYCLPCKKEVPALIELEKKYGVNKKLTLLLIATDLNDQDGEAKDKAGRFLKKIGVKHDFLLDIYQIVISKYNPKRNVPATFLVNRAGRIVFSETGIKDDTIARLEQAILSLN